MALTPYAAPLQPRFRGAAFRALTRRWSPQVDRLLESGQFRVPDPRLPWVTSTARAEARPAWQPKLYVCVGSRDYWRCVLALQESFPGARHRWKFFRGRGFYDRPDKIVFYFESPARLRGAVPRLRRVLRGMELHELRHAASTAELGLEGPGARGLYAACDPEFLAVSWRLYRAFADTWATKNREYLDGLAGGSRAWRRRMNLSCDHEGPASLKPPVKDASYARRYWKLIYPYPPGSLP